MTAHGRKPSMTSDEVADQLAKLGASSTGPFFELNLCCCLFRSHVDELVGRLVGTTPWSFCETDVQENARARSLYTVFESLKMFRSGPGGSTSPGGA